MLSVLNSDKQKMKKKDEPQDESIQGAKTGMCVTIDVLMAPFPGAATVCLRGWAI